MAKKSSKKSPKPLLDLHGYKTDEVFDAVEAFLSQHSSKSRVYIMHGKGAGKVKSKVLEYLKLANYPSSVFRDEMGQLNEGLLTVHMD
ncbi:Smr/MutS family protein [bacterium]|nr:Smr/MutS family protein [bacterium]